MNLQDIYCEHKGEVLGFIGGVLLTVLILAILVGRKRFKWLLHELVKMYSAGEKSYFSKKRIESGVAFVIAQHGMLFWLAKKYDVMSTTDFCMWAVMEFAIAGWYVGQIQKEKVENKPE
jgi:hypothetical protein